MRAYKGQVAGEVAIAEGTNESIVRYDLFIDALKENLGSPRQTRCAIVSSSEKRYFAAEISAILIHSGLPAHVYVDRGNPRTYEWLRIIAPEVLVILIDGVREQCLPDSVELCVTFRRSNRMSRFEQLDFYIVDELGFLGHSNDCERYVLNKDVYYFERSVYGSLIVTDIHNRVRPVIRIETMDVVRSLEGDTVGFDRLSEIA